MDQACGSSGPYDYDLLVIGGGSGGLAVAKEAAGFGKKVLLLDFVALSPTGTKWGLGGFGVPRKLLHQASLLGKAVQDSRKYGWRFEEPVCHVWADLAEAVHQQARSASAELRRELRDHGVAHLNARGEIVGPHTVQAADVGGRTTRHTAETLVIATGDRPRYPGVPGDREHCITSDDLFSLPHSPGRTLVVGGSGVGLECAGFLSGLGLEVTVMLTSDLLKEFDRKMAQKVENHMLVHGVKFLDRYTLAKVEKVEASGPRRSRVTAVSTNGAETLQEEFNTVLLATGREACTTDIGLECIGVKRNQETGRIPVNEKEQSSVGYVYAVGSVREGRLVTAPLATRAGKLLARRLYDGDDAMCDYTNIPTILFSPMEYAACGLSEESAIETFGEANIEVYHAYYWPLEWTVPARDKNSCYAKVICHVPDHERVVGLHVLGPSAGEIIQGFAAALRCGLTKEQLDATVGVHPACAQVLTTLTVTQRATEAMMVRGNC